jgi:AraC-like DNA-binding protein
MAVHSVERTIRRFSGARCVRVIDAGSAHNPVHSHDWPILSLYVLGRQTKIHEGGEDVIAGPAAVLHRAEAPHANRVGALGLEQLDIQFDPTWLRAGGIELVRQPVQCWIGGMVGAASRSLAREWSCGERSEEQLVEATRSFLQRASRAPVPKRPRWLEVAARRANEARGPLNTISLARSLRLHPAWLAQAYRAATGEGLQETVQRGRIERAVDMLRGSSTPCAQIAAEVGFCDQSHMIRAFNRLLGRTPLTVRAEAAALDAS